ncbi:MAG: hypothetical protein U0667_07050 [Chloroflexota bacterium]
MSQATMPEGLWTTPGEGGAPALERERWRRRERLLLFGASSWPGWRWACSCSRCCGS